MPELPEVETISRGLKEKILGKTISSLRILGPIIRSDIDEFNTLLPGQRVQEIRRHGKFLFITLHPSARVLQIHLGMTGQLLFEAKNGEPAKHTHVEFHFEKMADVLRYRDIRRFGFLSLLDPNKQKKLGPDAWESSVDDVISRLSQRSGMLKSVLLNQQVIAGLGNIYVDESLYRSRLHPRKKLQVLNKEKIKTLATSIKAVLGESLRWGGTSFRNYVDTTGRRGGFKGRLDVYGKDGTPCPTCARVIKKIVVAGRGTHFCPGCQKN